MKKIFYVVCVTSLLFGLYAEAQTRCPMGAQAGSMQCLPDEPQGRGSAPSRPTGEWLKTWGAIARSDSTGEAGTAANKLSEDEARAVAIHQCALGGARDCKINLVYHNQCSAIASSQGASFFQASPTEQRAVDLAMKHCQEDNTGTCKVFYSECTKPIFRKY